MAATFAVNASWEAPDPSLLELNTSSCNAVSAFWAYISTKLESNATADPSTAVPIDTAINYVRALLPPDWTQPSAAEAILWYQSMASGEYEFDKTMSADFAYVTCNSTICPYLNMDGDADLSGIGMMISYYMAAIFVTVYYFVLAPELCQAFGHSLFAMSPRWRHRYLRLASGFEESLQGFLDAMLLFTISMLVAAITRYASLIQHPDDSYSLFNLLDCVFLSTFSVFPGFVLQSLSHELRRRRIRLALWFLVMVFAIAVDVLYNKRYLSIFATPDHLLAFTETSSEFAQMVWLVQCQSTSLLYALQTTLKVGHVLMILNCSWWIYYVVASVSGGGGGGGGGAAAQVRAALERRARLWRVWEQMRLWLRLGNGLVCLGMMWVFLGLFTTYRKDVASKAGGSDEDNEWTFGQVLALVTWIPVGIDLVVVYIYGAKEGLAGKMSAKYKVVSRSKQDMAQNGHVVTYQQAEIEEEEEEESKKGAMAGHSHIHNHNVVEDHLFHERRWPKPPLQHTESWLDT